MTDNNRPARPQAPSRFGELNDSRGAIRPDDWARPSAGGRPAAGGRPSAKGRPSAGGRPAAGGRPTAGGRPAAGGRPSAGGRLPARRPAPGEAGPSAEIGGRLPRGFGLLLGVCAVILAAGLVLQGLMPNGFQLTTLKDKGERPVAAQVSEIHGNGPIRINEVMTANGGVLIDANGNTPDWVELANISSRPVNLRGYVLAKSAKAGNLFQFPDLILEAGECAVIYCDSTLKDDPAGELHAPFRLSSSGDVLMLFNDADVAVDTLNLPALVKNQAYVRRNRDTWQASDQTTPGMANTEENYRAMTSVVTAGPVKLVELVASTVQYGADENGTFHDYVLLRNDSGADADLSGWYLSDDPVLPRKWKFPEGASIPAGGTLIVHCSGMNRLENLQHLHTSFKLASEGETVTLSNASGQPVDSVTYDLLRRDEAYLRGDDGAWHVGTPTVGEPAARAAQPAAAPADSDANLDEVAEDEMADE